MDAAIVAQTLGSLIAVILVILVFAWVGKRLPQKMAGRGGALRVHTSIAVGTRERVVLVQAGQEWLVLGVSPGQVRALHVLSTPPADFAATLAEQGQP